jgi:hypothetical protein
MVLSGAYRTTNHRKYLSGLAPSELRQYHMPEEKFPTNIPMLA